MDTLPPAKFVDANKSVTISSSNRGRKETLNNSLEKDSQIQRLNNSVLNANLVYQNKRKP